MFSRTVSRVLDLSARGEVHVLVTVCLGHTRAQQGCVAAPLLLLLFPVWGSPSVCSRWELQSAWPGPQMRVGPEPWGTLQVLWLQHKGSEIIVLPLGYWEIYRMLYKVMKWWKPGIIWARDSWDTVSRGRGVGRPHGISSSTQILSWGIFCGCF